MKNIKLLLVIFLAFAQGLVYAQNYTLEIKESKLAWHAEKVTGEHYGEIFLTSGDFSIKNDKVQSGNFVINMNSMTCLDLENEGYNKKLIGHLKSDDFFSVESFPTATFEIKKSSTIKGGNAIVTGDLTIKGITHPVEFKAVFQEKNGTMHIYGKVIVDRTRYNIKYGSGSFFESLGDKTIYDDFTIKLNLKAKLIK